jgi:hypothetical protein
MDTEYLREWTPVVYTIGGYGSTDQYVVEGSASSLDDLLLRAKQP